MGKKFDCSGWATRTNVKCSDGRTIMENAFVDDDGKTVPVIWNHDHDNPNAVLGHALLEHKHGGIYAHISFNDTEAGQNAKLLVQHGDINRLSIYANKLRQRGGDVVHGIIREVSLVLAGANPEAMIDSIMCHSDNPEEEGYFYADDFLENVTPLFHSEDNNKETPQKGEQEMADEKKTPSTNDETIREILDTLSEKQMKAVYALIGMMMEDAKKDNNSDAKADVKHSDDEENKEKTIKDVLDNMTEEQRMVVDYVVGMALQEAGANDDEEKEDDKGGNKTMKHNLFDKETETQEEVLTHSEMKEILAEAKKNGSLADTFLAHGITNIDYLFPEAKTIDAQPGLIKRDDLWVKDVMAAVHKTPFARIKSVYADITPDEARAKGYVKGNKKTDEVFSLLKRVTTPTTVYKKQKLDRDDLVDITGMDTIAFLKGEMRMMLDEEIARAILVGDGRGASHADKINEQNIRPIWTDDDVYTVKVEIPVTSTTDDSSKAKAFIKSCIKSRKKYKGSGSPTMYMSEDMLTECLLLEDSTGRVIYDTMDKLATALRVKKIVPVPVMEDLKRVKGANTHILGGIYVNLTDYNVGADKGGAVNMFDDFDIDYNAMKYLIETRCSGALTKPYAAVVIEFVGATSEIDPE